MLSYYFKFAWRNIIKNPGYSMINIAGLAIGMACSLLVVLWVSHEFSYDRYHEHADDIYRVIQKIHFTDHTTTWAITQGPLGPSLKKDFAEVVNFTRFTGREFLLTYKAKSFDEGVIFADGSLFTMFTLPLIKGDPATALSAPNSMVLTEPMAEKYFGSTDPIGKIITADHQHKFTVTGVMKNIPHNSVFHGMDFFIPFIFGRQLDLSVDRWNNSSFHTLLQLQTSTSYREFNQKISDYLKTKPTIEKDSRLRLQPLTKIHLYSNFEFDVLKGDINAVIFFSIVAVFILFIACVNFMNLATARLANRAGEVGLRKVAGAHKIDIAKQFLGESILQTFTSMLAALVIVELLLPVFNRLAEKELSLDLLVNYKIIFSLLALTLITGIISSSYPALVLSAFQPINVLRGNLKMGTRGSRLRKILITFTFAFAIAMIICTITVNKQLQFMQNKKLGYEKEQMIVVESRGDLWKNFESVKRDLLRIPNISAVTAGAGIPGIWGYWYSNSLWHWEGQGATEEILMRVDYVNRDFFRTFNMEIVQGRYFSYDIPTVATEAVIINEMAVKAMRMESPVGKQIWKGNRRYKVIGVVKDYHLRSLHQKIDPLIILYRPEMSRRIFARVSSEEIQHTVYYIERVFKKWAPGYPFEYRFLNDAVNGLYNLERRTGKIIGYFSVLTIIIACVGLFGLAAFMSEQRTKEIGIRKTLGASVWQMVTMLVKEFAKCILVANIFAWPIAYVAMNDWLGDYAFRIELGIGSFLQAGLLALAIALTTVAYQAIKAARANPADALRYE